MIPAMLVVAIGYVSDPALTRASRVSRSSRRSAGNSEPALTWNTPLLIYSRRTPIPYRHADDRR